MNVNLHILLIFIFFSRQKKVTEAMKADARFQQFLIDPTVKTAVKIDGLTGASQKLGLNELTKNLLLCLAENHRYDDEPIFFPQIFHLLPPEPATSAPW